MFTGRMSSSHGRWVGLAVFTAVLAAGFWRRLFPSPVGGGGPSWILDLAVATAGGFLVRHGFRLLREKNMVENVPSSPIRSVALGLSEIKGRAPAQAALRSPLSGSPCHYYRFVIEELRHRTRGGDQWVIVDEGQSADPFHVVDATGRILIDPRGGDIILKRDYRRIERPAGWLAKRRRYTEWRIDPGDFVYVIGTVSRRRDSIAEGRDRLRARLRAVKRDPATLRRFDLDGSGALEEREWAGAVAVIKDEMLREEAARGAAEPFEDLVIGAGDTETTFLVSDRDERSLAGLLGWMALGAVLAGGVLGLAMIVSILGRTGVLPGGWTFPWGSLF